MKSDAPLVATSGKKRCTWLTPVQPPKPGLSPKAPVAPMRPSKAKQYAIMAASVQAWVVHLLSSPMFTKSVVSMALEPWSTVRR